MNKSGKKKPKIRLADLRYERKITQKELADTIGIDPSTIANYEAGTRIPEYPILTKLADYFGISIDYLLGRVSSPHTSTIELAVKGLPPKAQKILLEDSNNAIPFLEFAADCIERGVPIEEVRDFFKNIFVIKQKMQESDTSK